MVCFLVWLKLLEAINGVFGVTRKKEGDVDVLLSWSYHCQSPFQLLRLYTDVGQVCSQTAIVALQGIGFGTVRWMTFATYFWRWGSMILTTKLLEITDYTLDQFFGDRGFEILTTKFW